MADIKRRRQEQPCVLRYSVLRERGEHVKRAVKKRRGDVHKNLGM